MVTAFAGMTGGDGMRMIGMKHCAPEAVLRRLRCLVKGLLLVAVFGLASTAVNACQPSYHLALEVLADEIISWRADAKHPLIGTVIADGKPLAATTGRGICAMPTAAYLPVIIEMNQPDIVLLGEVHDNAWHHRYRAAWIRPRATAISTTALVSEHIRTDQQPALDEFKGLVLNTTSAAGLFRLLDWENSGWPHQKLFEPVFAAAIAAKLPILPGDPAKGKVREVSRGGFDVIAPEDRARMRLDTPLPASFAADLAEELKASHCGLLPDSALPSLSRAQHYRDAHLADALLKAANEHGSALLIAGNGHVRTDRSVPWHLKQRTPDTKVVSVMLIEVEDRRTDAEAYVPRDPDGKPAADYILLTPRAEREDPCAAMRKAYEKK